MRCARMIMGLTLLAAACGGDVALHGVVRSAPLEVGQLALTEVTDPDVRAGGIVVDGRLALRAATDERLLLVYFGFLNCPDVCPTTLADLRSALTRLGPTERERIDLAFITVDPDRDGPEELAAALDAFLASATVEVAPDGRVDVAHSAVLYAVDSTGRVVIEWPFGTSATALAEDLAVLLRRAPAGRA